MKERAASYHRHIGGLIGQEANEAFFFYRNLKNISPEVFVEIGSFTGGSLYCFAGACREKSILVAIDDDGPWKKEKRGQFLSLTIERLKLEGYRAHFVLGKSGDQGTKDRLLEILEGRPVDALFIDGDHSSDGFRSDFELYHGAVKKGGLVGCHDIYPQQMGVWKGWEDIKKRFPTEELRGPNPKTEKDHLFNGIPVKGKSTGMGIVYV